MLFYLCPVNYNFHRFLRGHAGPVYTLVQSGEPYCIYSGSSDGVVAKWDLEAGEPLPFTVKTDSPVFSVLPSGDRLLIGQHRGGIHVIDLESKKEVRHLKYHKTGVFALAEVESEQLILSAGGEGNLAVSDRRDFRHLHTIPVSAQKLRCIVIAPGGKHAVVGGSDGFLRVFDTAYFNEVFSVKAHDGGMYSAAFLHADTLVTGGRDAHLRFWKFTPDQPVQTDAVPAYNFAVYSLSVHPDQPEVFAGGSRDKTCKVWSLTDIKRPVRLERPKDEGPVRSVNAVCFSERGKYLTAAGDDRMLTVWRAPSVEGHNGQPAS